MMTREDEEIEITQPVFIQSCRRCKKIHRSTVMRFICSGETCGGFMTRPLYFDE